MTQSNLNRLAEVSRVEALTLTRDAGELSLRLNLREQQTKNMVVYLFSSVSNLRFRGERTELNGLVLLLAEDFSTSGWEDLRYAVKDHEEEFISFWCARIERIS